VRLRPPRRAETDWMDQSPWKRDDAGEIETSHAGATYNHGFAHTRHALVTSNSDGRCGSPDGCPGRQEEGHRLGGHGRPAVGMDDERSAAPACCSAVWRWRWPGRPSGAPPTASGSNAVTCGTVETPSQRPSPGPGLVGAGEEFPSSLTIRYGEVGSPFQNLYCPNANPWKTGCRQCRKIQPAWHRFCPAYLVLGCPEAPEVLALLAEAELAV
jgi:hypothetical protein